jgi:hypothetical protein
MKDDLEKFIADNREGFDTKTPPPFVLDRILEEMQPEKQHKPKGILISFRAIRWAAACLILLAGGVIFLTLHKTSSPAGIVKTRLPKQQADTAATHLTAANKPIQKSMDSVDHDLGLRKQALLAKLQRHRPVPQKEVTFASLRNMESPAGRINAAAAAERLPNQGNDVIDALVQTLNSDPSSNVRLAALDGLARFYQESYARGKLVDALKKQRDPVVQIALINLLVRMRASGVLEQLDKMANDENTQQAVKDCAYSGILELRSS